MNSKARNVAFSNDGSLMLSSGDDNRIYVWDLASRTCVHAFNDEGCLRSSALAVSPDGQHVATGSDSGVVNIYNSDCLKQEDPTPLKAIMNLTTRISNLTFNHDGQMLAMGSCEVKHAVRMVHMSSLSVFSNWPSQKSQLSYNHSFAFSPNGGYFALGTDKGLAPLYRINHYSTL
eukprot:TRINITY_DN10286_c0_g1_i3.p1 TRINITY_DN10286_c0_g1~~TRINITY_DN10286_c0_g1_i3.p1  ORF type:complete len:175 (+),score=16.48 TRINITY_DN10286_c0_g1_i3:159-683(+)